jgi:uncharacterized protein with beta-barrel porin domain
MQISPTAGCPAKARKERAWKAGVGGMNKQVGGAVTICVRTGGRWTGKIRRSARISAALAAVGLGNLLGVTPTLAQDATWLAAPTIAGPVAGSFDFDDNNNWNPTTVPGSLTQTGTATFGASNGTSISFSFTSNTLGGFTFTAGASNYTFFTSGSNLTFNGAGIVVNGGSVAFANLSTILFLNASSAGSAGFTNSVIQFGRLGGTDTASAGTATITNSNNSSTTQFNANTTAGSAVITNSNFGITNFSNASTAGTATITNDSNGFTQFGNPGNTDTASAGTAAITNNSGGTTQFLAHTTAGSAAITNNSGGTTKFGQSGGTDTASAGSATITNNSGGTTQFLAQTTAGSATIMNNGGVTQFGQFGGTETVSAGNATITNSGGFTNFFAHTTAGSAAITNNSGGSVTFSDSSTAGSATFTNNGGGILFSDSSTAGSAAITNNSGGTQFNANSNAGNATITNNGVTNFNGLSTAGSAAITNNSGGTTFFQAASTAGNSSITNNSGGATEFFQTSTAGSAAITNSGGSTIFNNTSTVGSATITNNNGTVAFFQQSDGGTAHLINGAAGIIDFSGSTGPLGNGVFNVGSLAGSGTFIVGERQLVAVSGSLAFTSGAIYLVQVSGPNAGQIAVGGTATLAGNVEVDVLSRLTQKTTYTILSSANPLSGTFNSVSLANNFATNPTLSYVGNTVELTLGPGLLTPILPGNASANQVKVASAIDNALLAGNNLSNAFGAIFNASGNALLNGVTQLSGETAVGSQQTTFNAMGQFMGLLTDPFMNRGGGFNVAPGASGFAEESQASAYAAKSNPNEAFAFLKAPLAKVYDPRWSVWASGFGGSQSTSGNTALGSNNTTSTIGGTAVGADYLFSPNTIAGFAVAGGGTSFNVANGGTGRSDLFQIGAYVRHVSGPAYVSASLAYGWQDITTNRTVTVAGFDQLRAQFNANAWSGRVEGGYRFVSPWVGGLGITPYAAAQFVTFDLPAYAEQAIVGMNTFALGYGAHDVTDARTELGVRTDKSFAQGDGILTLRGRLAWAHDYDPDRSIAATFQTLPGASFTVNGAAQASDSVLTTASIEKKWRNGWSAAATFEGEFSEVTTSYAGKGVVRYQW